MSTWGRKRRRWRRRVDSSALLLVALAVVVAGIVVASYLNYQAKIEAAQGQPGTASLSEPTPDSGPDSETVVVVVGDSFTGGSDMNKGPTWAERLGQMHPGWMVVPDGIGGTGYIDEGATKSFPHRIDETTEWAADLFIIAGGRNDTDDGTPTEIGAAADKYLTELQHRASGADVVMFSPFASGESTETIDAVTEEFRQVAAAHHVGFVDVTGFIPANLIGSDGLHPVDAGHALLAKEIDAALERLDVPRADAYRG